MVFSNCLFFVVLMFVLPLESLLFVSCVYLGCWYLVDRLALVLIDVCLLCFTLFGFVDGGFCFWFLGFGAFV